MAGFVTVACRLPLGIVLQEFKMMDEREQTPNGVRDIKVGRATGRQVVINGNATAPGKNRVDLAGNPVHMLQSGYALTPNVDEELWNNWLHFHKDHPLVTNGMIFADSKSNDVHAQARANDSRLSGLERMVPPTPTDPKGDPRAPAKRTKLNDGRAVSAIATAVGSEAA